MLREEKKLNPPGFSAVYYYSLHKHYRIYFSSNPAEFLGIEEQLGFARLRQHNPAIEIHFIYSSKGLNESARQELRRFCQKYQISPVDFDRDLPTILAGAHDNDRAMYALAQAELQHVYSDTTGCVAAAAECVRMIVPVIENYGIYSDFNIDCDLAPLGMAIDIKSPILLNATFTRGDRYHHIMETITPDFIALAYDEQRVWKISPAGLLAVRNVQEEIMRKYREPMSITTLFDQDTLAVMPRHLKRFFVDFALSYPDHPTVFDFRRYLAMTTIPDITAHQLRAIRNKLYIASVVCVSGTANYASLFKQLTPRNKPPLNTVTHDYSGMFHKSCLSFYHEINACITTSTNYSEDEYNGGKSWTLTGRLAKKSREDTMRKAATTIGRMWRHGCSDHAKLHSRAKACATPQLLRLLKEKRYTEVLRNACDSLNVELVALLLGVRKRLGIDINELSADGYTALDAAKWATVDNHHCQEQIVRLLESAQALTSEQVCQLRDQPPNTFDMSTEAIAFSSLMGI